MSNGAIEIAKGLGIRHNVCIRVIDEPTGKVVSEHIGHNAATNSLVTGIGHFLVGEGIMSSGELLRDWVPQYISLGTMGLGSQEEDEEGLPRDIGTIGDDDETRCKNYMLQTPGYGSDGYDTNLMNGRPYSGLGPTFANRPSSATIDCELISDSFPRSKITYREIMPEYQSELPKTVDIVFSAMVSTGALAKFRESGKGYVFISEVGLWSTPTWADNTQNGLLAGYRICPPDIANWDMSVEANRKILRKNIIKIKTNQIAQIIWKIQLGGLDQLGGLSQYYPESGSYLRWNVVM